jgi:hypothetical protein
VSYEVILTYYYGLEQVKGIEPSSPAWKAEALAIVLHLQILIFSEAEAKGIPKKLVKLQSDFFNEKI